MLPPNTFELAIENELRPRGLFAAAVLQTISVQLSPSDSYSTRPFHL